MGGIRRSARGSVGVTVSALANLPKVDESILRPAMACETVASERPAIAASSPWVSPLIAISRRRAPVSMAVRTADQPSTSLDHGGSPRGRLRPVDTWLNTLSGTRITGRSARGAHLRHSRTRRFDPSSGGCCSSASRIRRQVVIDTGRPPSAALTVGALKPAARPNSERDHPRQASSSCSRAPSSTMNARPPRSERGDSSTSTLPPRDEARLAQQAVRARRSPASRGGRIGCGG